MGEILETTQSLCPICLSRIEAYKVKEDSKIYMVKRCNEHGEFKTILWRGHPNYEDWKRPKTPAYPLNPLLKYPKDGLMIVVFAMIIGNILVQL